MLHFVYFYLISISTLGYGFLFSNIFDIKTKNEGIIGISGIFFLILISYLSSFFFAHDYFFNFLTLLIGLFLLVYFIYIKKLSVNFKIHIIVFLILFLFILSGKNHDDFSYYHFPYTYLLTQDSHVIGLGILNNGFRNPSSMFYLNSLFYLPKIEFYLFHIGSAIFLGYINLFLINNILDKNNFKNSRFYNFLNLIIFLFTNIFFSRLSEYGTDRIGILLVMLIFMIILFLVNNNHKDHKKKNFTLIKFLLILVCISISLKPFFLIYIPLILVLLFYSHLHKDLFQIVNSKLILITFVYVSFSFLITFINSSCFIFPAKFTCIESLSWSIPHNEIQDVKNWYELWAKGGATPNLVVEDRANYITNFNWVSNWIDIYFFNKVSDFILGLICLSLVIYLFFKSNKILKLSRRKYYLVFFIIFLFLIEWFINHPSLRYGGYHLFALIFFIPLAFYLEKKDLIWKVFFKRAMVLIIISILIFSIRNVHRINKEYRLYGYNVFKDLNYKFIGGTKEDYLRYDKIIKEKKFKYEYKNILGKKFLIIKQ